MSPPRRAKLAPGPELPLVPAGEPVPTRRAKLTVSYDGSGFRGFAAQRSQRTVAGVLSEAIERAARHPVELTCAGRTDAGVHAFGQVVHCEIDATKNLAKLAASCTKMLAPDIVVRAAEWAHPDFDARHSALSRRYSYTVLNAATPSPFHAGTSWHIADDLDIRAMILAVDPLIGEHDFASFCRRPPGDASTERRVIDARWEETTAPDGRFLRLTLVASSFCHQMVRSLVGTIVEMGRARRHAGEMAWILRAKDRSYAAQPAPPHGLCLEEVVYPAGM